MVINPLKAFLFLAGGTVAAVGTAYVSGALDPYLHAKPSEVTAVPQAEQETAAPKAERLPSHAPAAETSSKPEQKPEGTAPAQQEPIVPAFDIVRVEPDGSVLVAGKAEPNALVEMLIGEHAIGAGKADASGDFAIVLDQPLKPGDYQLTLRATTPDASAVASAETAVVSIPQTPGGQVLAMVEAPGKASEVITAPTPTPQAAETQPVKPAEAPKPGATEQPVETAMPSEPQAQRPPQQQVATAPVDAPKAQPKPVATPVSAASGVGVQAVEIEGSKIFVAGNAEPGRTVRVYVNEMLLGEAKAASNGRFLVEAEKELPVGSYTIRADVLGDGAQVIARAAVPFQREPGESIAAVAPSPMSEAALQERQTSQSEPSSAAGAEAPKASASEPEATTPVTTAPKLEPVANSVIIRRGDSLWRISRRVYGRGIRYSTIYLANQDQIANPHLILPGQVFAVPLQTKEGEAADLKAMGEQMTSKPAMIPQ